MDEEIQECTVAENGFMSKLCQHTVPQDTVPPNASLLAASASSGMLAIAQSEQPKKSAIVVKNFADVIPKGVSAVTLALGQLDSTELELPSACFWLGWSPDDSLLAIACVSGDIQIHGAVHLGEGKTAPISQFQFPNLKQLAWAGNSKQLFIVTQSHDLLSLPLAVGSAPKMQKSGVTAVATRGSLVAVAEATALWVYQHTDTALEAGMHRSISVPADDSPVIVDGVAFISDDTIILEV